MHASIVLHVSACTRIYAELYQSCKAVADALREVVLLSVCMQRGALHVATRAGCHHAKLALNRQYISRACPLKPHATVSAGARIRVVTSLKHHWQCDTPKCDSPLP